MLHVKGMHHHPSFFASCSLLFGITISTPVHLYTSTPLFSFVGVILIHVCLHVYLSERTRICIHVHVQKYNIESRPLLSTVCVL